MQKTPETAIPVKVPNVSELKNVPEEYVPSSNVANDNLVYFSRYYLEFYRKVSMLTLADPSAMEDLTKDFETKSSDPEFVKIGDAKAKISDPAKAKISDPAKSDVPATNVEFVKKDIVLKTYLETKKIFYDKMNLIVYSTFLKPENIVTLPYFDKIKSTVEQKWYHMPLTSATKDGVYALNGDLLSLLVNFAGCHNFGALFQACTDLKVEKNETPLDATKKVASKAAQLPEGEKKRLMENKKDVDKIFAGKLFKIFDRNSYIEKMISTVALKNSAFFGTKAEAPKKD